jgi:citrate lyase subunit beta/citryl-CoA lyase
MRTGLSAPRLGGTSVAISRSFMFVSGDPSDRFVKPAASGADLVVCDLEDTVALKSKSLACDQVVRWREQKGVADVRISSDESSWFENGCAALAGLPRLGSVLVPKAEKPAKLVALSWPSGFGCP